MNKIQTIMKQIEFAIEQDDLTAVEENFRELQAALYAARMVSFTCADIVSIQVDVGKPGCTIKTSDGNTHKVKDTLSNVKRKIDLI